MAVNEIVLFVSSLSKFCITPIQIVHSNNLPVIIIRLDSEAVRQKVLNGPHFSIHEVPTLLVRHADDNTQLFTGNKVIELSKNYNHKNESHVETSLPLNNPHPSQSPRGQNRSLKSRDYKEISQLHKPDTYKKMGYKEPSNELEIEYIPDDNTFDYIGEEESTQPQQPQQPNNLRTIDDPKFTLSTITPPTGNSSLRNIAKQLENERTQTLGYAEENLPKPTF